MTAKFDLRKKRSSRGQNNSKEQSKFAEVRKVTANLSQTCRFAIAVHLLKFCGICGCRIECKFALPSSANKFTLNIDKTKAITFKTRDSLSVPPNLEIKLHGNALDKVTFIKFLGVTIHEHLTWKSHMELLLKKIRMGRGIMKRVKPYLNQESLQLLYHSMIQSHFQYCISSWYFNSKTLILKFQNTTNKVIRLAFNAKRKADIKAVIKKT